MDLVLAGIADALTPATLAIVAAGASLGIVVGAVPGLNGPMVMAILVPVTFYLPDPLIAVGFLVGIMKGSAVGGAVPAILFNTPGTPDSAMTALDGHALARRGRAGTALKTAHAASVTGDILSDFVLFTAAAPLAVVALQMSFLDKTGLVFFSLCVTATVIGPSVPKGLIAAGFGLFLAAIGTDIEDGQPRLAFGIVALEDGLPVSVVAMGLLVLGEIFRDMEDMVRHRRTRAVPGDAVISGQDTTLSMAEYRALGPTILRSAAIGTCIGAMPGVGSGVAAVVGYATAQRASPRAAGFGRGEPEGIAAAEAANSAVAGANMIPLLALGIPGNIAAVFLAQALVIHGVTPGPLVFEQQARLLYGIFTAMVLANLWNAVIGRTTLSLLGQIARIPRRLVYPVVVLLVLTGILISTNSDLMLALTLAFGVLGYLMRRFGIPFLPLLIAFVVGRMFELPLIQAIITTRGDPWVVLHHPVALGFFTAGLGVIYWFGIRHPGDTLPPQSGGL